MGCGYSRRFDAMKLHDALKMVETINSYKNPEELGKADSPSETKNLESQQSTSAEFNPPDSKNPCRESTSTKLDTSSSLEAKVPSLPRKRQLLSPPPVGPPTPADVLAGDAPPWTVSEAFYTTGESLFGMYKGQEMQGEEMNLRHRYPAPSEKCLDELAKGSHGGRGDLDWRRPKSPPPLPSQSLGEARPHVPEVIPLPRPSPLPITKAPAPRRVESFASKPTKTSARHLDARDEVDPAWFDPSTQPSRFRDTESYQGSASGGNSKSGSGGGGRRPPGSGSRGRRGDASDSSSFHSGGSRTSAGPGKSHRSRRRRSRGRQRDSEPESDDEYYEIHDEKNIVLTQVTLPMCSILSTAVQSDDPVGLAEVQNIFAPQCPCHQGAEEELDDDEEEYDSEEPEAGGGTICTTICQPHCHPGEIHWYGPCCMCCCPHNCCDCCDCCGCCVQGDEIYGEDDSEEEEEDYDDASEDDESMKKCCCCHCCCNCCCCCTCGPKKRRTSSSSKRRNSRRKSSGSPSSRGGRSSSADGRLRRESRRSSYGGNGGYRKRQRVSIGSNIDEDDSERGSRRRSSIGRGKYSKRPSIRPRSCGCCRCMCCSRECDSSANASETSSSNNLLEIKIENACCSPYQCQQTCGQCCRGGMLQNPGAGAYCCPCIQAGGRRKSTERRSIADEWGGHESEDNDSNGPAVRVTIRKRRSKGRSTSSSCSRRSCCRRCLCRHRCSSCCCRARSCGPCCAPPPCCPMMQTCCPMPPRCCCIPPTSCAGRRSSAVPQSQRASLSSPRPSAIKSLRSSLKSPRGTLGSGSLPPHVADRLRSGDARMSEVTTASEDAGQRLSVKRIVVPTGST